MLQLLAQLGTTALAEIVKKMVTGGMAWAANRKEPEPDIVELKLGQIAKKNLPETIPADQRQAVVTSLVDLVMPTFEQVVEFNPNIQRIRSAMKKAPAKKAAAKKSAYRTHAIKKSAVRTHATKKATAVKKSAIKKTSTRKSAPRR